MKKKSSFAPYFIGIVSFMLLLAFVFKNAKPLIYLILVIASILVINFKVFKNGLLKRKSKKQDPWQFATVYDIIKFGFYILVVGLTFLSLEEGAWRVLIVMTILFGTLFGGDLIKTIKRYYNFIVYGASMLFLLVVAISFTMKLTRVFQGELDFAYSEKGEITRTITLSGGDDSEDILRIHNRIWRNYDGKRQEGEVSLLRSDYHIANVSRITSFKSQTNYPDSWTGLYHFLYKNDQPSLERTCTMFDSLRKANQLNVADFAKLIVTCVQDIPYVLVHQGDCSELPEYDEYHNSGMCAPYTLYGVHSPAEFVYSLKGDCDTRTLFLYSVLKFFNYDVAILGSEYYRHSILGIAGPFTGTYKMHNGKKYYVWETTARNWQPGIIPPDVKYMHQWKVDLQTMN